MLLAVLAILGGFILISWAADRLVMGASGVAAHFGVSPLMIGLTIVAFGTSAPEIVVSAMAALTGNSGVAIGNAIGSNIMNIALVLGITALIRPMVVQPSLFRQELPWVLGVTLLVGVLFYNQYLGPWDGVILLSVLAFFLGLMIYKHKKGKSIKDFADEPIPDVDEEATHQPLSKATLWLVIGLILLPLSSRLLVWGAVEIATFFGVSDLIIGLTIIAIGTSLPELATSVMGALKQEHDIAIGNIVGSNIFNLLAVLSLPGLIDPGPLAHDVWVRDYPFMLGLTILLVFMAFTGHAKHSERHIISRSEGGVLTLLCAGYLSYLVWTI